MNMLRPDQAPPARQAPPPVAHESGDEIDLGQLLVTLWRGKLWIALLAALALAGGAFHYANTPPTFQADALIQLEDRGGRLALPEAMRDLVESSTNVATETQILSSRMVLGQAVAELNLDWEVQPVLAPVIGSMLSRYRLPLPDDGYFAPFARPGERLTLDLLQVPPQWVGSPLELTVTGGGYQIITPDGQIRSGVVGETLSLPDIGFALNISDLQAPPEREYVIRQISMLAATNRLRGRLSVSESGRQSGILQVTMTAPSRRDAARWLDAALAAYAPQSFKRVATELVYK